MPVMQLRAPKVHVIIEVCIRNKIIYLYTFNCQGQNTKHCCEREGIDFGQRTRARLELGLLELRVGASLFKTIFKILFECYFMKLSMAEVVSLFPFFMHLAAKRKNITNLSMQVTTWLSVGSKSVYFLRL